MSEENKNDIMETNITPETPRERAVPAPAPLTWRDGAIPLLALGMSLVFWASFDLERLGNFGLPHLGVLALVALHFAAVFTVLGKKVRLTPGGLFCTAAALSLGVSCAVYEQESFTVLNCFVILLTAAMATFSLSGHGVCSRPSAIPDAVRLSVLALCTRLDRPFRAAGRLRFKEGAHLGQFILAVLAAIPVVAVVLWLLASADAVFESLFESIRLPETPPWNVWHFIRAVVAALFIASALYFIREDAPAHAAKKPGKPRRALPFLVVTVLLDIVYVLFCAIQIRYLFGGARDAAMAGGWAQYARSGFFQLVAVAAINLGLCLLGTDAGRFASQGGKFLRACFALTLLLTAVILTSAFWRMRLYILAFGMSILRLQTLWAMAVIGAGLLAAAWKLRRPDFLFFRVAGGFALGLWCVLCLANPAGMIAKYNVDHYLSGQLEELDTGYLLDLGPDTLPSLHPLQQAGPEGTQTFELLMEQMARAYPTDHCPWAQWSLSSARTGKTSASAPIL